MRELMVTTFLTLDGVMQAPGDPDEDPTGGFSQGGWSVNYWEDSLERTMADAMSRPFDLLLGRKTYEIFAAHWPYAKDDPVALILNTTRKYVASRTLTSVGWNNSRLLVGDVVTAVTALKEQPGPDIQVHGSWQLAQALIAHDLVDRYHLWTFPVVVGRGKRLFSEGAVPRGLVLGRSKTSARGVIVASYTRGAAIPLGSLALEQPTEEELERRRLLAVEG